MGVVTYVLQMHFGDCASHCLLEEAFAEEEASRTRDISNESADDSVTSKRLAGVSKSEPALTCNALLTKAEPHSFVDPHESCSPVESIALCSYNKGNVLPKNEQESSLPCTLPLL